MPKFKYIVTIECESSEIAALVMSTGFAPTGFPVTVEYKEVRAPSTVESSGI